MSKTLNDERRVDSRRREFVRANLNPIATPPAPVSVALPPVVSDPAAVSVPQAAAGPLAHPAPSVSPDAVRPTHRWYSALTFFIAFGMTLGVVRIVRTSLPRTPTTIPAPLPPLPAPPIPVSAAPSLSIAPLPPEPTARRTRDPFAAALAPKPDDTALAEATRAYHLMEAALRDAASTLPAPQPNPSAPIDPISVPE